MRVSTFRMASNDSDDPDNEVALYFSQSARKPPSTGRGLSDLTCMGLVQYLGKWGLSQQVCAFHIWLAIHGKPKTDI